MITMHWWQAWLGIFGAAAVMSAFSPVELVKYVKKTLIEMRSDNETPWYAKLLVLAGLPVMALTISGYWLAGFITTSFVAGWRVSVYFGGVALVAFLIMRWANRRFPRHEAETYTE